MSGRSGDQQQVGSGFAHGLGEQGIEGRETFSGIGNLWRGGRRAVQIRDNLGKLVLVRGHLPNMTRNAARRLDSQAKACATYTQCGSDPQAEACATVHVQTHRSKFLQPWLVAQTLVCVILFPQKSSSGSSHARPWFHPPAG